MAQSGLKGKEAESSYTTSADSITLAEVASEPHQKLLRDQLHDELLWPLVCVPAGSENSSI